MDTAKEGNGESLGGTEEVLEGTGNSPDLTNIPRNL